jgi:hypothetical protein
VLEIRPIHLKDAKEYVKLYHRHNVPPVGGKFAVSCYDDDRLCGVAICGRPIARNYNNGEIIEIYRNCTDGTPNACSKLYGACLKIAKDMGYKKAITYTLESENGASLRASNFTKEADVKWHSWDTPSRPRNITAPACDKQRWGKILAYRNQML